MFYYKNLMVGIAQSVEQQVVGLEAEGSTPSIYPIFSKWSIEVNNTKPAIIRLQWTLVYINSLQQIVPNTRLMKTMYQYKSLFNNPTRCANISTVGATIKNPMYNNFLSAEFKQHFKQPRLIRTSSFYKPKSPVLPLRLDENTQLLQSFKSYIRINSNSLTTLTIPHFSFKHFYLGYRRGGVAVLNINKFFTRWKDVYYLMFNLFFYKIDALTFGTSFFKQELLSLNWQSMKKFKFMWRYTRPFLSFRSNKITTYGDFVFYRLNLLGMRLGLVIDVLYHSKTIYYLHRSGFYTMGLVPINYNINTLNFAVPSTSDSLLTQVFFIRFMSLIKQNTLNVQFSSMQELWWQKN